MENLKYSFVLFFLLSAFGILNAQNNTNPEATFKGKWTLIGISAFAEPGSLPKYKPGAYIWDFGDGRGYKMTVSHNDSIEPDDFALRSGDYPFWVRDCLVKIDNVTYRYQFEGPNTGGKVSIPANEDGSPAQVYLYLDTNMNPRIPDGGYKFILRKW